VFICNADGTAISIQKVLPKLIFAINCLDKPTKEVQLAVIIELGAKHERFPVLDIVRCHLRFLPLTAVLFESN
jgi:hypothetical protein